MRLTSCAIFILTASNACMAKPSETPSCQDIMKSWLDSLNTSFDPITASLKVPWKSLEDDLIKTGCQFSKLWVELWSVNNKETMRFPKYDSPRYFDLTDGCNNINADLFKHHSTKALEATDQPDDDQADRFKHVIAEEIFLRLCPCGKTADNKCNCDYKDSKPLCSQILKLESNSGNEVFDWCTDEQVKLSHEKRHQEGEPGNQRLDLLAPKVSTPSVVFVGLRLNNAWASGTVLRPLSTTGKPPFLLSSRSLVSGFKCKLRVSNSRPPYSRPRALTTRLYTIDCPGGVKDINKIMVLCLFGQET